MTARLTWHHYWCHKKFYVIYFNRHHNSHLIAKNFFQYTIVIRKKLYIIKNIFYLFKIAIIILLIR